MAITPKSFRIATDELAALRKKSQELGLTQSELVRLSIQSFLNKESLLDEVKSSHSLLAEQIEELNQTQEEFREKMVLNLTKIFERLPAKQ